MAVGSAQWINMPPFTSSVMPVQYSERSLARKTQAPPMSSARPRRASGIVSAISAFFSSVSLPLMMSVPIRPGVMLLTRMPSGPNSRAIARANPSTPALDAAAALRRNRRDADDRAALARLHRRQHRLRHVRRAAQTHVEDAVVVGP